MENRLADLFWKWDSWEKGSLIPNEFSLTLQSGALRADNKTPHHGSSLFLLKLCQCLEEKSSTVISYRPDLCFLHKKLPSLNGKNKKGSRLPYRFLTNMLPLILYVYK